MRRSPLVLAFLLAATPLAAQQDPETFDRSGMPARPTTFVEQQIEAMIAAHHPGDIADAARIQLKLAGYYAAAGDDARAGAARARAAAAGAAPASGQATTRRYGDVAAPKYGDVATRKYGDVAAPKYGDVAAPTHGDVAAPATGGAATTAGTSGSGGSAVAATPAAPRAVPGGFSGSFYAMVHGSLYSWDFAADGTYMFRRVASGSGTAVGVTERGRYAVGGSSIRLTVTRTTSAYSTPTAGGRGTALGAGSDASGATRTVSFRLLSSGRSGMELDGVRYKVRSW